MNGYIQDLEAVTLDNDAFRHVIYTAKHSQLVVMALRPGEELGMEIHEVDQFFRIENGTGEVVLDGVHTPIKFGFGVLVPAGTRHNILNTGKVPLKLYTVYAPPHHRDGVVHLTRVQAGRDLEDFDGKTSEMPP